MKAGLRQLLMGGSQKVTPMLTVACGNSISAASQYLYGGSTGWDMRAELQHANSLAGAPMAFQRLTATTRSDAYGVYGYGGQTLETINGDIRVQWLNQINTGSPPDLVVGLALLENDIAGGATVAAMQSRLDQWIGTVRAEWPRAIIMLRTPLPSFSYNTAGLVAAYQAMRDYTLSKDNGRTIFVARGDTYEDSGNPGLPLADYTDASVHPTAKGAFANARVLATTLRRMRARSWSFPKAFLNQYLTGSIAATGTNVSGTMPTNGAITGTADATYVSTANNPGWSLALNTPVAGGGVVLDTGIINSGEATIVSAPQMSSIVSIQIVSGATNLRAITVEPRYRDGSGMPFRYHLVQANTHPDMDYIDGDVLTFITPPMAPVSGSFTGAMNYIRPRMKNTTGAVTFKVTESCFYAI